MDADSTARYAARIAAMSNGELALERKAVTYPNVLSKLALTKAALLMLEYKYRGLHAGALAATLSDDDDNGTDA